MPNNWFTANNSKWMLDHVMAPVTQLTRKNLHALKYYDYMVGPKADGNRSLLLCESSTNHFYIVSPAAPPARLQGAYIGPKHEGFLLDVEVVLLASGVRLILAFDFCCSGLPIQRSSLDLQFTRSNISGEVGYRRGCSYSLHSLMERRSLLNELVHSSSISGLVVKPIAPARDAELCWKMWQSLPYKTDGLIFTPLSDESKTPIIKWKPLEELTIDVALGGVVEENSGGCLFIAHLYQASVDMEHLSSDDNEDSLESNRSPPSLVDIVAPHHQRFSTQGKMLYKAISLSPVEEDDDIIYAESADIENIMETRHKEAERWSAGDVVCCSEECPCGEQVSDTDFYILHCVECGALGVGKVSFEDLSEDSVSFQCLSKHTKDYADKMKLRRLEDECACRVWIPKECTEWARHSIVEVEVGAKPFDLRFKRVRFDKQRANSFSVANDILFLHNRPIQLSCIQYKKENGLRVPEKVNFQTKTAPGEAGRQKSSFATLREHHACLKGWLYTVFGGPNVIDACAGGLHDMSNWIKAGFSNVVAIENDENLYEQGLTTIDRRRTTMQSINISTVKGDLSKQLDLSMDMMSDAVDAIFCNFAIHYFWQSCETTDIFLRNLCPLLKEEGRFVVTFLQGEVLRRRQLIEIYNDKGALEFQARLLDAEGLAANIYVASIGVPHDESVIELTELKKRFDSAGFDLVSWFPFETLACFLPKANLTPSEAEMSSLYAAAIFQKRHNQDCHRPTSALPTLLAPELSTSLEKEILNFLSLPDLVKCRSVSKKWHREMELVDIPEETKKNFFSENTESIQYDRNTQKFYCKQEENILSPSSVALYLRFGGSLVLATEVSDDADSDDEFARRDFSDNEMIDLWDGEDFDLSDGEDFDLSDGEDFFGHYHPYGYYRYH